jgi:hypothetical protein
MKLKPLFIFSLVLFIVMLPMAYFSPLAHAESGTDVGGLITSDTTWTKQESPYVLTGPLAVQQGVTLTIGAGTTVNLGYYYLQINGTLTAKGTDTDGIRFNGGSSQGITFTAKCSDWNQQTGSGCVIQYATVIPKLVVNDATVKIDHCTVLGIFSVDGSSIVTNNNVSGGMEVVGAATVSGNRISGTASAAPSANQPVLSVISESSPDQVATIADNVIQGGTLMFGNKQDTGISCYGYVAVTNNTIMRCEEAIRVYSPQAVSFPLINRNTIYDNLYGILIRAASSPTVSNAPIVEENLITNNTVGIFVENHGGAVNPAIEDNNLYANDINFQWGIATNIAIPNNYWGTTNETAISQSIYDSKNDFNLGTVTFQPIMTSPNPNAPKMPEATSTPVPSPTIPEFTTATLLLIITATSATLLCKRKHIIKK